MSAIAFIGLGQMGAASREVYNQARAAGRGREDWTAILEQVRASAGLKKSH